MSSVSCVSGPPAESASLAPITTRLVDTEYLCDLFHVSRNTLFSWEKTGRIPKAIRIGRKLLWRIEVIENILGAGPAPAAVEAPRDESAEDRGIPAHRGTRTASQRRRAIERAERQLQKKGV